MGRKAYQKTVLGTVVVVSLVWLSVTIVIVMYHEELMKSRRLREYNKQYDHLDEIHHLGPFLRNEDSRKYPGDKLRFKHDTLSAVMNNNLTANRAKMKNPNTIERNMNTNTKKPSINNERKPSPEKKSPFIQKLIDSVKESPQDGDKAHIGKDTGSDLDNNLIESGKDANKAIGADKPEAPEVAPEEKNKQKHAIQEKHHVQQEKKKIETKVTKKTIDKQSGQEQNNEQEQQHKQKKLQVVIKDSGIGKPGNSGKDDRAVQGNHDKSANNNHVFMNPLGLDFDAIEPRAPLDAPGEMGKSYAINKNKLPPGEKEKYEEMFEEHQFSKYVSDKISVRRRLSDGRLQSCKDVVYDRPLPTTSIIICFHNEAFSVMLRTIWSVLDRSPLNLIKEIILVDDFSSSEELKKPLEDYIAQLKIVKIVRTKKREGLIRARLLGYSVATGEVLTFLDSHCECFHGWLEPLLTRIAEDSTRAVTPVINSIGHHMFGVDQMPAQNVGVLHLDHLSFHWDKIPEREKKRRTSPTEPYRSPTMAGGIFSISKDYFEHIGLYDAGMEIWGAENVEMSIRIWTCGGSIELHPCSHVAHIFRFKSPYSWGRDPQVILKKNTLRMAEVWLDEYRFYYYEELQFRLGNFGDVSERKALRQRLQCRPFSWFIKNVYPEVALPQSVLYSGEVRNVAYDRCLDTMGVAATLPMAQHCHGLGGNQYFRYYSDGSVNMNGICLLVREKESVVVWNACNSRSSRFWDYTKDNHLMLRGTNMCMELTEGKQRLQLNPCSSSTAQKWIWTRKLENVISGKTPYLGTGVRNKFIQ
ncbi:polypeptide N-acetylgalactosaminyltransferase 13-like [Ylistrum balloti]|uniref:polypeptide N-acetylgalactosaminyltransferase 13-like n=1 Tax=Ylistrum balloti TaxID=509963 RepID=UPI002905B834|nr:polypeptide N-acetylgalactosaminyltransferase 13-like [Ylistrum balloti]